MNTIVRRQPVSSGQVFSISYRVLIREISTVGRLVGTGVIGVVAILIGWAVGAGSDSDDRIEVAAQVVSNMGLVLVVPIVSLVFASVVLSEMNEDGTLVYLWLRPMDRAPIVLGGLAAALSLVLPLIVIPVVGAALAAGADSATALAALLSSLLGGVVYGAVFGLLSLVVKRSILWGMAYILIWEGVVASIGTIPSRLSLRGYTRSILTNVSGMDLGFDPVSTPVCIVVLVAVAVVATVLASVRLNHLDVA